MDSNWNEVSEDVIQRLDWGRSDDQYAIPASGFSGVQDDAAYLRGDLS